MDRQVMRTRLRGTGGDEALLLAHTNGGSATRAQLEELLGDGHAAQQAKSVLADLGLTAPDEPLDGTLALTRSGISLGEYIAQSRIDGPDRRAAVQRELLAWVKEQAA